MKNIKTFENFLFEAESKGFPYTMKPVQMPANVVMTTGRGKYNFEKGDFIVTLMKDSLEIKYVSENNIGVNSVLSFVTLNNTGSIVKTYIMDTGEGVDTKKIIKSEVAYKDSKGGFTQIGDVAGNMISNFFKIGEPENYPKILDGFCRTILSVASDPYIKKPTNFLNFARFLAVNYTNSNPQNIFAKIGGSNILANKFSEAMTKVAKESKP